MSAHTLGGGRYRVEQTLGRGGMGQVYRAYDTTAGRPVAVKQLRDDRTARTHARSELRFRREYHTLARLEHPRIVAVYDYVVDPTGPFYTMELLDGRDLKERVGESDVGEVCRIVRDVAAALAMLHVRGLVHRDIAPRNVRCTADGHAKLIDFGVLATVGVSGEVAGTVPYIAPESLRGMPLDGRADLYSLGVLAYEVLTGSPPHDARRLEELERSWRRPVSPPSHRVPAVPEGLDDLIMSLLCLDPSGRPSSAAEVIERVSAVGKLDPAPAIAVERGYLASAAMVGRRHEMKALGRCIELAAEGRGNAAFIEAESGTGKSRLLREVALEAQVEGAVTASVSCETASGGPYVVIRRLVRELLAAVPEETAEAAGPDAPRLVRLFPELAGHLGPTGSADVAADPAEERMRLQKSIADWLLRMTKRRTLALLVDDVQRCDEASAAVLAVLARECAHHRLFLLTALRSNEALRAPHAVNALRKAPTRLLLTGLDAEEIEELVRSLFGDVPYAPRLASYLREVTGGSPTHCTELTRHLVEHGVIRYADGVWVLPADFRFDAKPVTLAAAMQARVGRLPPTARRVGEALSVHGGDVPLELCVAVASDLDASEVFAALDELIHQGVIIGRGHTFRFRHDGLREALLEGLDEERRRALHLLVGDTLARTDDVEAAREAEVGWHLHAGGDLDRAVVYLERAGRRLYEAQALTDCIDPLQAAVAIHEQRGDPPTRYLDLRSMLLAAGWVSDYEVGMRHALPAVSALRTQAGLDVAARLGGVLGKHLAFFIGLSVAFLRWALRRPGCRGPRPDLALVTFMISLGFACGLANAANHVDRLLELVKLVEPLAILKKRLPYAAYLGIRAFPDILLGRLGDAGERLSRAIEIVQSDSLTPATEVERRFAEVGLRGLRALVDVNQLEPRLHEDLRVVDEGGFRYYQLVGQTTRVVHHRYRGEEAKARHIERSIETATLQLASWSTDVQILLFAHPAYAICRDVMGLKRCLDALERRCEEGFLFQDRVRLTRAELLRERGELEASLEEAMTVVRNLRADDLLFFQWGWSTVAETALSAGDFEGARDAARRVVDLGERDPDARVLVPFLRCARIAGVAEHALGDRAAGIERIERAIRAAESVDCPPLAGTLHEARARIALADGDRVVYALHCAEATRWFRFTENPALIAVGERLQDAGVTRSSRPAAAAAPSDARTWVESPRSVPTSGTSTQDGLQATVVDQPASRRPESSSVTEDDPS